ncbi:MAG: hypothetical protein OXT06_18730 [Rhodospirillaceae bacterium]|nr:hypothetical protein [Rhodospirillaceae bacterium]
MNLVGTSTAIDRFRRGVESDQVVTGAPKNRIGAAESIDRVVPGAALNNIDTGIAIEEIVAGTADQIFESDQHVDIDFDAGRRTGLQIGGDTEECARESNRVNADATIVAVEARAGARDDEIVACAAEYVIVSATADKRIVARIAGQRVVSAEAEDIVGCRTADQNVVIVQTENRLWRDLSAAIVKDRWVELRIFNNLVRIVRRRRWESIWRRRIEGFSKLTDRIPNRQGIV